MYRTIDTSFWTDPKIRSVDSATKLLALHLVTNDQSHVSGIYVLRKVVLPEDLGLTVKTVEKSFNVLCQIQFCFWDDDRQIVWVKNMLARQGRGPKISQAVASHLKTLHESPLIIPFLERYSEYNIPYTYPIDRVSIPYPEVVAQNRIRTGSGSEQKQDQDQEIDTPSASLRVLPVPDNSKSAQLEKIRADFENLAEKFPHLHIQEEFERWNDWMDAKGKTFKSYPAAFRNWCNAEWKKPTGTPKPPHKPSLAERIAQRDNL